MPQVVLITGCSRQLRLPGRKHGILLVLPFRADWFFIWASLSGNLRGKLSITHKFGSLINNQIPSRGHIL